jgi:Protein of unknown function (DUF3012)
MRIETMVETLRWAGIIAGLAVRSPEVGSKERCDAMKNKPKGDRTANEATDFARHCIL